MGNGYNEFFDKNPDPEKESLVDFDMHKRV